MVGRPEAQLDPKVINDALERLLGRPTISIPDYAKVMGIGLANAYRAAHTGEVATVKHGRITRIPSAPIRKRLGLEP